MNFTNETEARAHLAAAQNVRNRIVEVVKGEANDTVYTAFVMLAVEFGRGGPNGAIAELDSLIADCEHMKRTLKMLGPNNEVNARNVQ